MDGWISVSVGEGGSVGSVGEGRMVSVGSVGEEWVISTGSVGSVDSVGWDEEGWVISTGWEVGSEEGTGLSDEIMRSLSVGWIDVDTCLFNSFSLIIWISVGLKLIETGKDVDSRIVDEIVVKTWLLICNVVDSLFSLI